MRQRDAIASVSPSTTRFAEDEPFGRSTRDQVDHADFLSRFGRKERKDRPYSSPHDIDEAIYLADRTVVRTAQPGRVREIIDVDLPRPRRYEMRSGSRSSRFATTSPASVARRG